MTWREIIRGFIPNSPLVRHLGIEVRTLEPDRAELLLPYRAELATMGDVVHGGAIATLIDTAGMAAAWAHDEQAPEGATGSTVSMTVEYLAAARGGDLLATGTPARRGRTMCFCDVEVTEPPGERVVAKGMVVYRFASTQ
ncbi:MAG TPA: PaaI family thioesterase [Thermoleophilaceae bacterium]